MGTRETNVDSTNLPMKVSRSGKVVVASNENKKDEDAASFKRLMARMQEEVGPGGYLHGRGALDHDDILYLKEQQQAEHEAERLRKHTEKRAFAAFKAAASSVDLSPSSTVVVESKSKKGIRQNDLLKSLVEVKAKRPRVIPIKMSESKIKSNLDQINSNSSAVPKPFESDSSFQHQSINEHVKALDPAPSSKKIQLDRAIEREEDASPAMDSVTDQKSTDGVTLLGLPYDWSDEEGEER